MANIDDIRNVRIQKLELLRSRGINPYPSLVPRDYTLSEIKKQFDSLVLEKKLLSIAGRCMAIRGQGAIFFVGVTDGTDTFQAVFHKGDTDEAAMALFAETVDVGDTVSFTGTLFTTQKGEKSILVQNWTMAAKSLLPLPEKWHGLQDDDERYRKRYLDILTNTEVREVFYKKSLFWKVIRRHMEDHGFMEVVTPTLEVTTGGAECEPFTTYHNDFNMNVFLRISAGELWQKRLMAAGFPKTFEIGRVFRNEGSSPNHLQEFTNIEFYWSFADFTMGQTFVKELYRKIGIEVFGTTVFSTRGHTFNLADEWAEINYGDEIQRQTGVDIMNVSKEDLAQKLRDLDVSHSAETQERMIDVLWKYCRKHISGPAFIVGYPDFMQPLAKRDRTDPRFVEQFQVLLGGAEIGKGYSELNDPIDQRERFKKQQELAAQGDKETMMADMDFVEMLEHGMPPTFGFGAGDRLFAFLVDKPIRETELFPLMKPRNVE